MDELVAPVAGAAPVTLRRSTALKRTGRWRAKLTRKREERRARRAEWAQAVKARDRRCRFRGPEGFHSGEWTSCSLPTTDAHHVLARSQGGADDLSNGLGLCHAHHMHVHAHRIEAQTLGLLAHVGDCSELPQ